MSAVPEAFLPVREHSHRGIHSLLLRSNPKPHGHHHSLKNLCDRYQININTAKTWLRHFNKGDVLYDSGGRPTLLDEEGAFAVIGSAMVATAEMRPLNMHKLRGIFKENVAATKKRRLEKMEEGLDEDKKEPISLAAILDSVSSTKVGREFIRTFVNENPDISSCTPQTLSIARVRALKDSRLVFGHGCLVKAFSGNLPAELKWNADATTIEFKVEGSDEDVFIVHPRNFDSNEAVTSLDTPNQLSVFLKWFHYCNAKGDVAPLIVIVSCKGIPEGEFFATEVAGLTNTSAAMGSGWIYFASSRAGNAAMWKHFFTTVVVPFLKTFKEHLDLMDKNGIKLRLFFSTDGEAIIINQIYDDEVLAAFRDATIDYLKLGASLTSHQQPLDVSSNFKDVRAGVKAVIKNRTNIIQAAGLRKSMSEVVFKQLHGKYPGLNINSVVKTKLVEALEILVSVLKGKHFTEKKMQDGFIKCGHHVVDASSNGGSTVSVAKIMTSVEQFRKLSPAVLDQFLSKEDIVILSISWMHFVCVLR